VDEADAAANEKSWTVNQEIVSKFLIYFYPQVEANVVANHRVNEAPLKATIVSSDKDTSASGSRGRSR